MSTGIPENISTWLEWNVLAVIGNTMPHLIRPRENGRRHSKAERLGGLEVYRHLEFDRQLNRQISRLGALENAIDVERDARSLVRMKSIRRL